MITTYAIKIGDKYFNGYQYADKNTSGRYGGNTALGTVIREGDIIDLVLTDKIERTVTKRSLSSTLICIYNLDKYKDKKIEILPVIE